MRRHPSITLPTALLAALLACPAALAAPVIRSAAGADPAAIQAAVDQFRADLGANNGVGGSFASGRREINWDGVPDAAAEPNFLAANFFNVNSPRGVVFSVLDESSGFNQFRVSATAASGVAPRFGNLDPAYGSSFQAFSAQRLFQARNGRALEVLFFLPGTSVPATVAGFGVVFTDADSNELVLRCFAVDGTQLAAARPNAANGGLSFIGFTFNSAQERCARVLIVSGNRALASGVVDGGGIDVIAMDDFIYGEPRPIF